MSAHYGTLSFTKSNQHGRGCPHDTSGIYPSLTACCVPIVSGMIHQPYRVLASVDDEPTVTIPNQMEDIVDDDDIDDDFAIYFASIVSLSNHGVIRDACRNHYLTVSMVQALRERSHDPSPPDGTVALGVCNKALQQDHACTVPLHHDETGTSLRTKRDGSAVLYYDAVCSDGKGHESDDDWSVSTGPFYEV